MKKTRKAYVALLLTSAIALTVVNAIASPEILFRYKSDHLQGNFTEFYMEDHARNFDLYVDEARSLLFHTRGGSAPFSWSVSSGSLPEGMNLNTATGEISGTPGSSGTSQLVLNVEDANGSILATEPFNIHVLNPVNLDVVSSAFLVGQAVDVELDARGGRSPYTFSLVSGSLPSGLSISAGSITGTPSTIGDFAAEITVRDANNRSATSVFETTIRDGLVAGSLNLPDGYVGDPYSAFFSASGGVPPYHWEFLLGTSLPNGLTLSSSGQVSGTPLEIGTTNYDIVVLDDDAQHVNGSGSISIIADPVVTQSDIGPIAPNSSFSQLLASNGGKSPLSWSVSGSLPSGMTLDPNGSLSGVPNETGTFSPSFRITDANSRQSGWATVDIHVFEDMLAVIASSSESYIGDPFSLPVTVVGGKSPHSFTASNLPIGLSINPTTGVISGTPTTTGTSVVTTTVTDALGDTTNGSGSVTVYAKPNIASGPSSTGRVGTFYEYSYSAGEGVKTPISWSVISGSIPDGMTLSAAGLLSGTPTTDGTYNFTVQAADVNNVTATRASTMTIAPNEMVVTIASNENAVNVQNKFGANWSASVDKRLVINSGVVVGATSQDYALVIPSGWTGELTIENNGSIQGLGGAANSGAGGNAIKVNGLGQSSQTVKIHNNGSIYAGGGGGGKGGTGGRGRVGESAREPATGGYYHNTQSFFGTLRPGNVPYQNCPGIQVKFQNTNIQLLTCAQAVANPIVVGGWTYRQGAERVNNTTGIFYEVYREKVATYYDGGVGGNGGRGQGYNVTAASGAAGTNGGTNAGKGGTGGAGGTWGVSGGNGSTGATGNDAAGTAGVNGGLAGFSILNPAYATVIGSGAILGR